MNDGTIRSKGINRRMLVGVLAVAAVSGTVAYRMMMVAPAYPGGNLTVDQAFSQAKGGEILLIDIRRPDEWSRTGIPQGAHPIDMRREDFVQALTSVAGEDKSRPVALICAAGVRSARLGIELADMGFINVLNVPEGMMGSRAGPGWLATDLPTTSFVETSE